MTTKKTHQDNLDRINEKVSQCRRLSDQDRADLHAAEQWMHEEQQRLTDGLAKQELKKIIPIINEKQQAIKKLREELDLKPDEGILNINTEYDYDYVVFIGRMQPPHKVHIDIIKQALTKANNVIVLLGSSNQPRTIKNPFTWIERQNMIERSLVDLVDDEVEDISRLFFEPIEDCYNDQQWVVEVQETIAKYVHNGDKVGLIGHDKDESTYYLKMFPQWEMINVDEHEIMDATTVRSAYFELGVVPSEAHLCSGAANFLEEFKQTDEYNLLVGEYEYIQKYRMQFANLKYAPTFVTVDTVVIVAGHVLTVQRKAHPGSGLCALPGGFINQDETLLDAALRELREETKLKVPLPVLKGSVKESEVFDKPGRSLRGRTITHAYLIELEPTNQGLPRVKGGSDAKKAEWIPLSKALNTPERWFEDHLQIIKHFLGEA